MAFKTGETRIILRPIFNPVTGKLARVDKIYDQVLFQIYLDDPSVLPIMFPWPKQPAKSFGIFNFLARREERKNNVISLSDYRNNRV